MIFWLFMVANLVFLSIWMYAKYKDGEVTIEKTKETAVKCGEKFKSLYEKLGSLKSTLQKIKK